MISLDPYINFRGNAEEALEFYKTVFGGELTLSHFSDIPSMTVPEGSENKLMHGELSAPSIKFFAADALGMDGDPGGQTVTLALSGDDADTLTGYYDKLSQGGTVAQPLQVASWGDTFGMLTDKFGILWMFNIAGKK